MKVLFGQPLPALSSGGRPKVARHAAGQTLAVVVDLGQRLLTLVAANALVVLGHFSSLLRSGGRTTAMGSALSRTRSSYQGGIAMAVTKSYVARNYGVRDRIIDNLGVVAAVLVVGFVLLFLSGAMDFGRDISVKIDQASMQGSAR